MEKLVEIIANGESLAVLPGVTVLQALRDNGVDIPALCYHPSLEPQGSCGLCMVEIWSKDGWEARHACLLEVKDGLQIQTTTPKLRLLRAWAAQVLLSRSPFVNKEIELLLRKLVKDKTGEDHEIDNLAQSIKDLSGNWTKGCILCGLCIRMCSKIGGNRLTYLGRGKNLRISLVPGKGGKDSCGKCRACFHICPTGFITPDARSAFTAKLYR